MALGNFLKGLVAQVNPFDRGKTYGSYNPSKKKKRDDEIAPNAPVVPRFNQNNQVGSPQIQTQRPENLFAGLNKNLALPGAPNNNLLVPHPQPQPYKKPGLLKTIADTAIGTVANIPEVGLAAVRAGTGIVQGAVHLPSLATHALTYVPRKIAGENSSVNRALSSVNRGVDTATNLVDKPFNFVNRGLDTAAKSYERNVPMAAAGAKVYKTEQIPLNVLAGLLTLGGSSAAQAGNAGKVGSVTRFLNKPRTSNVENIISKTGQVVSNKAAPVVQTLTRPIKSAGDITRGFNNRRNLAIAERDLVDAGETGNILAGPSTTQIPVGTGIDISAPPSQPITIPVRNVTPVGPPIRELGGDRPGVVRIPTPEEAAVQRAASRFNSQPPVRPDQRIEGVTPVRRPEPYNLAPEAVQKAQNDLIDQYAALLRDVGEGNGTQLVPDGTGGYIRTSNNYRGGANKGKKMTKADWRDQAESDLRNGKAESGLQKAFDEAANPEVQALLNEGEQAPLPEGRPITVKEAKGIPVQDRTVVPAGLPETPGTVRATTQTSPMATKSEAVANASVPTSRRANEIQGILKGMENDSSTAGAELKNKLYTELEALQAPEVTGPVVSKPVSLPAEVQEILDNPKQFNKRQVAAARNQRKMARQVAKANEDTAAAVERIDTVSPAAASGEGFTPTGEFGKSVNKGAYQKVSRQAEMQQAVQETSQMSPGDVLQTARKNQAETGGFNRRDIRNVAALFETKRIPRGTPEWNEARAILKEDGTVWGQTGALRNYTMRRTASADELMNRFESKIYRLADDPTKIESKLFDDVEAAENTYTEARDEALAAYNRFTESPTSANAKVYHAAQDAAEKADKVAKTTEYKVAGAALKGNKDVKQVRELEKMASDADLYQMDAVDASMLSGTGTFVRNFVNSAIGGVEESVFGGAASRISRLLTRENVGGGVGRGTLKGFGKGTGNLVDASKARAGNAGKNPFSHVKNWTTTGNQLGDTIIDSQVKHNVLDHYTSILKGQGYKGRELVDRASVMARQDPDDLGRMYAGAARAAAGLGGGITRGNKIEGFVKNMISDAISMGKPSPTTEAAAKLITRMTLGYPTAIGRSVGEGIKRFTLGAPTFIKALKTADPTERALLIKEGLKQAGTGGLVVPPLFYAMGASGLITGAYPSDPEERDRWEREGITENSVKIGDSYYQLPAYLGAWAVPGLFYASLGRNDGDFSAAAKDAAKIVPAILPTDNVSNWLDVVNGNRDVGKFMAQTAAGAVRAATPAGALLNQLAKSLDPTKNDTSTGSNWENFVDKVLGGVPGVNNMANIPTKEDDAGNPLRNPGAVPLAFGASSAVQGKGVERSGDIQAKVDTSVQQMTGLGVLNDPNLKAILDDKEKLIYDKLKSGKKLGDGDLKKLQDAFVKGVSTTGEDTAYLEREQYDTNLAVLRMKRELMNSDKTVKPSDLKKLDTAIKRGEVYKDNTVPYDMIDNYKTTGIDEWRKMGDPEDDNYDPDMYQKLWEIDQMMTKAGVSYKKGALDKNKFYAKEKKAGGKGSRGGYSSDFGTLKAGEFAPSVRAYQTIDQQTGGVPVIRTVRPNIVHKIGSSG